MLYYETTVIDEHGTEIASYLHDARSEAEALELARATFFQYHPNKDPDKLHFEARVYVRRSLVPAYDAG